MFTGEARRRASTQSTAISAIGAAIAVLGILVPTAAHATTTHTRLVEDVRGLTVRTVVASSGFGGADAEPRLPVSMTVTNHTGRSLRAVEARQAFDGDLAGAVVSGRPRASLGSVEYDSRGLMWQGDLADRQTADIDYALTAPPDSAARDALRELRPGRQLATTVTSTSAECLTG